MSNRLLLLLVIFLSTFSAKGQGSYVSFIKEPPDKERFNTKDSSLAYPVFRFRDARLSKSINTTLKADFASFYELKSTTPTRALLKSAAQDGLVSLEYNGVRNDDKVFSFYISSEAVGAYSTYWETTYTFHKRTGHLLTLDSLIREDKRGQFMALLQQMQKDSIKQYKKEMVLALEQGEIEKEDFEYIKEHTGNNCWKYFSNRKFKFYHEYIEVIIDCEFINLFKHLSPPSVLTIPIKPFKEYFKPEFID